MSYRLYFSLPGESRRVKRFKSIAGDDIFVTTTSRMRREQGIAKP
jgi:hypothetical protein